MIFGGIGKRFNALGYSEGLSSIDDVAAKKMSNIAAKFIKSEAGKKVLGNTVEYAVKSGAEGIEEVLAGLGTAVAKDAILPNGENEKAFREILKDENLLEQFVVGSIVSGLSQSGYLPGSYDGSLRDANKSGKDFITGLNANEQAVIDKEFNNRVAEAEKSGKLSGKDKNKIYDDVVKALEKGDISIDVIEEVLGGDTYKSYQDAVKNEDAAIKPLLDEAKSVNDEFKALNQMKIGERTGEQTDRLEKLRARKAELQEQIKNTKKTSERDFLQKKYKNEAYELAKGSKLEESYNERTRRGQAFTADVTKYKGKQRAIVQKAIDSGILNNTNKTHDFVDLVARIAGDKGVDFDFLNNAKLKESGFALDGVTVNGYFDASTKSIGINLNSAKALNTVVGHEITHVLEGTKLYNELQKAVTEYAKTKGEYKSRRDALAELYKNVENADIDAELTADLVGDYLFTDADFVNNLSANHRNVFQKIYDEIKYLCKVVTAGSKEARQLEKVKKTFEDAFRAETKNNAQEGGVKYALTEYTDHQKENWKSSNRIVVFEGNEQLSQFIRNSIENNRMDKKLYFGAIPQDLAIRIADDTGLNVENYNVSLGSQEIRKILKDHGDDAKESLRGQRAVTEDDFAHIVDDVLNPSKVQLSDDTYMGKPAIIFTGTHNGRMNVVAVVSDKRLDLFVQTIYVNVKKENLATPTGEQAPINTPEANSGTVFSDNSIPQNQKKSTQNTKKSLSAQNDDLGPIGDYNVYGEDVALEGSLPDDYAPIGETANSQTSVDSESRKERQAFTADVTKYNDKQRAIVQKAIDSGILNNTNKTHDFVDLIARIAGGKNIDFDFLNNAKLRESGFALDGVTVNGYFDANTKSVGINLNSAKALNTVVGHEITHVLEGTELYSELQKAVTEYAKTKGEYKSRRDALAELYKNVENADIDAELTADLVGDYLFTDADFVNNLSANHRNVFQKIYDEVKYLCKIATAGSKEARQLEKVKKTFEDAFRAETKNTAQEGGTKYSLYLSEQDIPDYLKAGSRQNKNRQMRYEEGQRMIVSTDAEFDSFVKRSIEGSHNEMVAYGKVDDLLARQVKKISNSQIDIADAYLELLSDDIKHAYNEHYKAKEPGDLDMTVDDLIFALKNVNQSEVVSARQYKDGAQRATLAIPTDDGMMILVELASKSAGALRLKTGWKITNEKFAQKYRGSTSATGSQSSTNTVSDDTTSNNSIPQNQKKSTQNTKNSLSAQNDDLGPIGDYNVYGKDVALKGSLPDDFAPIGETANSQTSVDSESRKERQAFTADVTKYNDKQRAIVQKAIDSGILNNTNKTHDFVDLVARIAGGKNIDFDFLNNEKLKESGFALDGVTVNGYFDSATKSVGINVGSAKALNTVVGHEITHVLEGTELYAELQKAVTEYAKTKGEYQSRYDALAELYKNVENADIDTELTADLVGDYLFTDADFVNNLSANHRNVFQKIYDEVKYLYKIATAGSKEARQLEKVKKTFEDAFRAETKNTAQEGGVKYSIVALEDGKTYVEASRNVINGTTRDSQRKDISNFFSALLQNNSSMDIHTIEGDVLTITKADTAHKARDDYKSINGQPVQMTDEEFAVKLNVEAHIDEVAEVSKKIGQEADSKNHSFAKDGFTYRRAYFKDFDGQYYEVTLSIGHNGTVATVYNVGKIKEGVSPSAKIIAVVGSKPLGKSPSSNSISQNSEKSTQNTKNSLSAQNDDLGPIGDYNVYGEDVALEGPLPDDYAPIGEDTSVTGFTGEYTGRHYNAKQSELLSALPVEALQNAVDANGNLSFNVIGLGGDAAAQQAWKDAGLTYEEDGRVYVDENAVLDERDRRRKANSQTSVDSKNGNVNRVDTSSKEYISFEDFANTDSSVWRNVEYDDTATKSAIMQEVHDAMVKDGSVIQVSENVTSRVEESFPDLRGMKKKERTPILKEAINKLKTNLRQFLNGFKNQTFEFEVDGKVLEAKLYNTGINEVLEKITQDKASMLYTTEEIFGNARYLYSTPDYDGDPNVYRWNYFYTPVQIGNETVGVRIAVRDVGQGQYHLPESQIYNWGIKKDASLGGVQPVVYDSSHGASSDASIDTSLDGEGRGKNSRISHGVSSEASNDIIAPESDVVKSSDETQTNVNRDSENSNLSVRRSELQGKTIESIKDKFNENEVLVAQRDINKYVENSYIKGNDKDYIKYAKADAKLVQAVSDEIDISGYIHALRDNDIRHIRNSHGERTNEKYPVTKDDIKMIPDIVQNYDKVLVANKGNNKGIVYVKVSSNGLVYYLEQVTSKYGNEKLLINKQMIKTGIEDIPDISGIRNAITKKQTESEFLADLKARQVYAQSVYHDQSVSKHSISETLANVNRDSKNNMPSVRELYEQKLSNHKNALNALETDKSNSLSSFDEAIRKKLVEYNGLKDKNTKRANTLLQQIENLRLRRDNVQADYRRGVCRNGREALGQAL